MARSFLDRLGEFGNQDAIVFGSEVVSYAQLLDRVADWDGYLGQHGVAQGTVVTIEGTYSPDMCAAMLALIERGAIIVPLSSVPAAKREEFLDVAAVEVVVTLDERGGRHSQHTGRKAENALYDQLRRASRPGLVLFSSGTTGRSKASVLDFTKVLGRYGDQSRPRRILAFLSLDHIGGINTLLHTVNQGGTVVTSAERSPDRVFATIAEHKVQVLPTTPTFLNMTLISRAYERYSTETLELVTYGTEPMPLHTLRRLNAVLPHVRFKQTYGLSELGIMPTQSKSNETLWLKLGNAGFEHKIVDGILWVRSEMAMLGYLNAPAPFDEAGFFNTQDMVESDGEYIRVLGRKSEIINVAGEKVYPSEVENVLLEIPNVAEACVVGQRNPVTGMVVKATLQLVKDEDEQTVRRRVYRHCRGRLEPFKVPMVIVLSRAAQHSERFKKVRSAS